MKRSQVLKEEREALQTELDELVNKGGEYTEQENNRTVELAELIQTKSTDIDQAEAEEKAALIRAAARQKAKGGGEDRELGKIAQRYSFAKAFKSYAQKENFGDGVEREMWEEAKREADNSPINYNLTEGVAIPSRLMQLQSSKRATLEVATAATAGNLVDTDLADLVPILRPELQVIGLGAQVRSGLTSNYQFVRQTAKSTFTFKTEKAAADATNPAYNSVVTMTPHRLTGYIPVTNQMLMQSKFNLEAELRFDIEAGIRTAFDAAAINGSGTAPEIRGILNTSGIGDVAGGTNGAAPDWADIVNLKKELRTDNVMMENIAWLTNPDVEAVLYTTKKDAGSGIFLLSDEGRMLGYPVAISTQVPSDLDKGSATGVCSAIIIGNWREAIVAQWGPIVIIRDYLTGALNATDNYIVHSWWDFALRHTESFAAMQDALTA